MFPDANRLEAVKLPFRATIGIALSSGALLVLEWFGLLDLNALWAGARPTMIAVCAVSTALSLVGIGELLLEPLRERKNHFAKAGGQQMTQELTHKELANHIYALITQNVVPLDNWGFYLFDPIFDGEQELRNKIGTVWLGALYDIIEQQGRLIPGLRDRAKVLGLDHLDDLLNLADAVMEVTKDVLALYSVEEQIFMMDFRNQLVHAWLGGRLQRQVHVKYFETRTVRGKHITHEKFADTIRPFHEAGLDNALKELIDRLTQPMRYWKAVEQIKDPSKHAKLREIVFSGLDGCPPLRPGDYSLKINI